MPITPDFHEKIHALLQSERIKIYVVPGKYKVSIRVSRDGKGIWLPFHPSYGDPLSMSPDTIPILVLSHYVSEFKLLGNGYKSFLSLTHSTDCPASLREFNSRDKNLRSLIRLIDYIFFDALNLFSSGNTTRLTTLFDYKIVLKVGREYKEWKSGSTKNSLYVLYLKLLPDYPTVSFFAAPKDPPPEEYFPLHPQSLTLSLSEPKLILPGMITGKI